MSMSVMEQDVCTLPVQDDLNPWPAEARRMMSSLNDSFPPLMERRRVPRRRHRVEATLTLSNGGDSPSLEVYTRDVNPWSLGFITPHALPAYEHAVLHMPDADGRMIRTRCLIRRCRTFASGWYQGVVDFECELPQFAA